MSTGLKKIFGHAFIYTIGIVLNRAISFIMLPVYTRYLSPADYGVLELLEMTVEVVTIMTGMGIHNGLFKFYYQYDTEKDRSELVSTLYTLVIAFYLCASLVGMAFSTPISSLVFGTNEYGYFIKLAFVNMFLQFLVYISLAYMRTVHNSVLFVAANSFKLVTQLSLNIFFLIFLGMGIEGILYSTMISTLLLGVTMPFYTFSREAFRYSREKAKKLVAFGLPFVVSGYGAFVLTFSDRFFINYYWGVSDVGIYSLAYKFGFLLMMFPVSPLMNIWMVQRFELVKNTGYERTFNKVLSWFFIITISVALLIALEIRDVLKVMSAPAFWNAYKIVPMILLAYFFQACTDFFNFGIFHTGKTRHMIYGTLTAVVVILALSFALIPRYGAPGAAWATLFAFAARLLYVYAASQRLFAIEYSLAKPAATTAVAVAIYLLYSVCLNIFAFLDNIYISSAFSLFLMAIFFTLLLTLGIISQEERTRIMSSLKSPSKIFA